MSGSHDPKGLKDTDHFKYIDDRELLLMHPDRDLGAITRDIFQLRVPVYPPVPDDGEKKGFVFPKFQVENRVDLAQGVIKITKEVLQNAMDREHWLFGTLDPLREIRVDFSNPFEIVVRNDGAGIPVEKGIIDGKDQYHITALFSRFKSSSNYKNTQAENEAGKKESKARFTGGKNGIGTKATNTYSTLLQVTTFDAVRGLLFTQTWENNLSVAHPPIIKPKKGTKGFTEVKFRPDWARFGVDPTKGLADTPGTLQILEMCMWGCRACVGPSVKVFMNDKLLPFCSFDAFFNMFISTFDDDPVVVAYDVVVEDRKTGKRVDEVFKNPRKIDREALLVRMEICATRASLSSQDPPVGFVNALACNEGVHMDYVYGKISDYFKEKLKSKVSVSSWNKFKPKMVRDRVLVGVRVLLDDPKFDAQTKEKLDSPKPSKWGFDWVPSPAFLKKLDASGVLEEIVSKVERDNLVKAVKTAGGEIDVGGGGKHARQPLIPKYECARNAGKKNNKCILFITEGDSAKNLVDAGISAIGKDDYGIFPIRGKPLNVRGVKPDKALENIEINNLLKIMGIRPDIPNQRWEDLNYGGGICGVTDQDVDGGHIMGLLMNLIHVFCSYGLKGNPTMMLRFATPQYRLTAKTWATSNSIFGPKTPSSEKGFIEFTSKAAMQKWMVSKNIKEDQLQDLFEVNYFKGLGSSTDKDAKRYFSTLSSRMIKLEYNGLPSDEAIVDMFDSKRADRRKQLLSEVYHPEAHVDYALGQVTWPEYLHTEVLQFSYEDNQRSLAHFGDGLKPSNRAVIFCMYVNNMTKDAKVIQVTGKVTEVTNYAHGEKSLHDTISHMAQDFWCTNNINYLYPAGQFGSRTLGRDSFSAPRYTFTRLNPIVKAIFPPMDFALGLVKLRSVDGEDKEPEFLLPVIPMVLVNGTTGIGTGWSCDVLPHNPLDVLENMRNIIKRETKPLKTTPWYAHFEGEIVAGSDENKFMCFGKFNVEPLVKESDDFIYVNITELPVEKWRQVYENKLLEWYAMGASESNKKKSDESQDAAAAAAAPAPTKIKPKNIEPFIKDIEKFDCTATRVSMRIKCDRNIYERQIKGNEMEVFFLSERLSESNMHLWGADGKLTYFPDEKVIYETFYPWRLKWYEVRRSELLKKFSKEIEEMSEKARFILEVAVHNTLDIRNRPKADMVQEMKVKGYTPRYCEEEDGGGEFPSSLMVYDHLLKLPLQSLTKEMVDKIQKDIEKKKLEGKRIEEITPEQLWLDDLDTFEKEYHLFFNEREQRYMQNDQENPLKRKNNSSSEGALKKKTKKNN